MQQMLAGLRLWRCHIMKQCKILANVLIHGHAQLTLMRRMRSVNFLFMLNTSVLLTVLLAGDLFRILYLAQLRE